jgi:hypothetical protein
MANKNMKSGEHPITVKTLACMPSVRAARSLAFANSPKSESSVGAFKRGRPQRQDNPQKTTLNIAPAIKAKAFDLATARRCSIGRLVEDLIAACKE